MRLQRRSKQCRSTVEAFDFWKLVNFDAVIAIFSPASRLTLG
jgi:hypothetical protein